MELTENTENQPNPQVIIRHFARLSDCIFAFAMALMVVGFDLPENTAAMSDGDIVKFLLSQLQPLGNYVISFIVVAFYWIAHSQQLAYYKRSNEVHLWIGILYLMCLFIVPLTNDFLTSFPQSGYVQAIFSFNIFLIDILAFVSWVYATNQHRLVDQGLSPKIIQMTMFKALIEPSCAIIAIAIAFINPGLWDYVWLLIPIIYIGIDKYFEQL